MVLLLVTTGVLSVLLCECVFVPLYYVRISFYVVCTIYDCWYNASKCNNSEQILIPTIILTNLLFFVCWSISIEELYECIILLISLSKQTQRHLVNENIIHHRSVFKVANIINVCVLRKFIATGSVRDNHGVRAQGVDLVYP